MSPKTDPPAERFLFTNVRIFDGTGGAPFLGSVLVGGRHIQEVAPASNFNAQLGAGARVINGQGGLLMPGLVESHAHLGFAATVNHRCNWRELTKEQHTVATIAAARTMLDYGFTSAYSGGAADPRLEVALRDAIEEKRIDGPRLRACSMERSASIVTGIEKAYQGIKQRPPDVAGVREFAREMIAAGVDCLKFIVTGESAIRPGTSRLLQFYEEELAAAGVEARESGVWLTGHCHSAESIMMALRHGFRVLYHCTWADEAAIDALEEKRSEIFVAPGPGVNYAALYEAAEFGMSQAMAIEREQLETLERVSRIMPELRRRGVRVLPGGDYGFPWNPIGKNARDLELFVKLFGFTPAETLHAATQLGGQIMGMGTELGLVRAGYIADLLLVKQDPLRDITVLQDPRNLGVIMKDGIFHRRDPEFGDSAPAGIH